MKRITVLGSTGSIGTQALDCIAQSPEEFSCVCLCAGKSAKALARQANRFRPELIGVFDPSAVTELRELLEYKPEIVQGESAPEICAKYDADIVVNGISGMNGFLPLIAAIETGKTIAAANKESIVCAHGILDLLKTDKANPLTARFKSGAKIIPVDSEQSAIFQCLEDRENVKSLILTASGGAFLHKTRAELERVTLNDALRHPTWSMGKKITIDSASLFNKGLEIMEAAFLFGFAADDIEVLIHPESIVHSAVRFYDGSIKAQLAVPDMRCAIQYAFTYPKRLKSPAAPLDLTLRPLTFYHPDREKYPAIDLAYEALREGNALPIVYNAANEKAVELFMQNKCSFTDIAEIVAYSMKRADTHVKSTSVCDIIEIDKKARIDAELYRQK